VFSARRRASSRRFTVSCSLSSVSGRRGVFGTLVSTRKIYLPVGRCIYCGTTAEAAGIERLSDEHVIPRSLAGDWVLPEASCLRCAAETGAFEGSVAGGMLEPSRVHFGWKSRKRKPPTMLPVSSPHKGMPPITVPVAEHPPLVIQPVFRSSPHLLTGQPLVDGYEPGEPLPVSIHITPGPEWEERFTKLQQQGSGLAMTFGVGTYFRMIAKIAHSYSVAEFGIDSVDYLLRDIILGKRNDYPNYIGPLRTGKERPRRTLHTLGHGWSNDFLVTRVRLYARIGAPSHFVVTGRKPRDQSSLIR
jgi:hypothetical protein